MLIDTHAHVNFNAFKEDADEVIKRALKNDIWMVMPGTQYSTSKRAVEIAESASWRKQKVQKALEEFRFNDVLIAIWDIIHFCDKYIDEKKPWDESSEQKQVISDLLFVIGEIAQFLAPFLPETSEKIVKQLAEGKGENLFPRK